MILERLHNLGMSPLWGSVIAGLLMGAGFISPSLWWLSIGGIVLVLHHVVTIKKTVHACIFVFVTWSIKSACALVWFWSAYPLDWVAIPSLSAQFSAISFYWATSAVWLGTGGIFFTLGLRYLTRFTILPKFIWYFTLPFLWLGGELMSASIFSILTLGPGSFIQSYFSFGQIGYLLGGTQLGLFLAGFWGVYGLTILLISVGVIMWQIIIQKKWQRLSLLIVSLIGLVIAFSFLYHPEYQAKNVTVDSINTQFSSVMLGQPDGDDAKTAVLKQALSAALTYKADYVLLPEDSRYFTSVFGDVTPIALASRFEFTHGSTSAIIIDSGRLDVPNGRTVLQAQIYDGRAKAVYRFDKQYLVPQGEYLPYLYGGIMWMFGLGEAVAAIAVNSSYQPGALHQDEFLPTYIPGVLFCFESVRPGGVMALTRTRALPFVAHPISHGWFHDPTILWQQLDVMLAIQARSTGVPIISAGNMTQGKAYLPTGTIITGKKIAAGNQYTIYRFEI